MKLESFVLHDSQQRDIGRYYWFVCPGCSRGHRINSPRGGSIQFDGNLGFPTFTGPDPFRFEGCTFFIRRGMIEFLGVSRHELAGQIVDMPDF